MQISNRLRAAVGAGSLLIFGLAACGGGGSSSPTPIVAPTSKPTAAPSPTATPTTSPQSKNVVNTAPLNSSPSLASVGRKALSNSLAGSATVLIESTGAIGLWAGNIVVWVTNSVTGQDVQETTGTTATTNGLLIDNPSLEPLSCTGGVVTEDAWCAAHPLGWYFGTDTGLTKPLGQQTITITFGDGSTGTVTDDIYNGFNLTCGQSMAYASGVPQIVTSNPDVTYDCANQQITFAHGYTIAAQPQLDSYGSPYTVISTVTAAVAAPVNAPASIPFSSVEPHAVYVYGTSDGGTAKMLPNTPGGTNFNGISLHAAANGSYAY